MFAGVSSPVPVLEKLPENKHSTEVTADLRSIQAPHGKHLRLVFVIIDMCHCDLIFYGDGMRDKRVLVKIIGE